MFRLTYTPSHVPQLPYRDPQPRPNSSSQSRLPLAQNLAPNTVGNSPPTLVSLLPLHETLSEPMLMGQELTTEAAAIAVYR